MTINLDLNSKFSRKKNNGTIFLPSSVNMFFDLNVYC